MIICSDVDGVILNYVQGFIDFTREENIVYHYNPERYGVVTGIKDAEQFGDASTQKIIFVGLSIMKVPLKF